MSTAKRPAKKRTRKAPRSVKPSSNAIPTEAIPSDCPYRPGTLYGTLFTEASKEYCDKSEVIKRVSALTGKSETVVNFAYQVLKSKGHRSNKNRSTELKEGDKVKLVAIHKNH